MCLCRKNKKKININKSNKFIDYNKVIMVPFSNGLTDPIKDIPHPSPPKFLPPQEVETLITLERCPHSRNSEMGRRIIVYNIQHVIYHIAG